MRWRRSRGAIRTTPKPRSFYALPIAAAAAPTDKTYADQLKAGAILEKLIASQPDHPGLAHYIIHSYDVPPLADRALDAARRYAKIAPSAPHALHMPSHTFTRVGAWQESIDTNIASAKAARRDGSTAEELHAMDYRIYAYLQTGAGRRGAPILDALPEVKARFDPDAIGSAAPGSAGVFALAAIPARYALERGAWADAAKLVPQPSRFLYPDALTYFAKALGAARTGDAAAPRARRSRRCARSRIGSPNRRKPIGPSRRRFSVARRRHGWRWSKGARRKRSRRCAPRRRWKTAPRKRP